MDPRLAALLGRKILGNSIADYGLAALSFLLVLAAALLVKRSLTGRLRDWAQRTPGDFDDFLVELLGGVTTAELAALSLYGALRPLALGAAAAKLLSALFLVVIAWRGALWIQAVFAYAGRKGAEHAGLTDAHASSAVRNLQFILNGFIFAGAALFVLDNLGLDTTTAVAGVGIGGIAVAMAAQHIFKDLFSSFVIFMDQPFKVGDAVSVDELAGEVEHIGIKTTRIRSVSGELLIFANSDLTAARIRNFRHLRRRRSVFSFAVDYATPAKELRELPELVRRIVGGIARAELERAHLKALGPAGIEYEIAYFVDSPDYRDFMDAQERLNLELLAELERRGIRLALAARTVPPRSPA